MKRPDLSSTRGKLKALIVTSGVLIVIVTAAGGVVGASSSPAFCASCHEMTPAFEAWQAGSHTSTSCLQCHANPGIAGLMKEKARGVSKVALHLSGSYAQPITVAKPVENARCLTCHKREGLPNKTGAPVLPPQVHLTLDTNCAVCHKDAVHKNIPQ